MSKDTTGLRSDVVTSTRAAFTICIATSATTMCGSPSRPSSRPRFIAAIPDNFEYPRFDLDICIFRAYENGQPAKPEHFLKWNTKGPSDGELTFVSGHPGKTDRQLTTDELVDMRDHELPYILSLMNRREVFLTAFAARTFENGRRVREDLFEFKMAGKPSMAFRRRSSTRRSGVRLSHARKNCAKASRLIRSGNPPPAPTIRSSTRRPRSRKFCRSIVTSKVSHSGRLRRRATEHRAYSHTARSSAITRGRLLQRRR